MRIIFSQTENDYLAISFADLRFHAAIKKSNYKRMKVILLSKNKYYFSLLIQNSEIGGS